jgi:hypothetical protein
MRDGREVTIARQEASEHNVVIGMQNLPPLFRDVHGIPVLSKKLAVSSPSAAATGLDSVETEIALMSEENSPKPGCTVGCFTLWLTDYYVCIDSMGCCPEANGIWQFKDTRRLVLLGDCTVFYPEIA